MRVMGTAKKVLASEVKVTVTCVQMCECYTGGGIHFYGVMASICSLVI